MKYIWSFPVVMLMLLAFALCGQAQPPDVVSKDSTKITLTIGNKIIPAILYSTSPARDLMARLPVTVSLNRGPVDYCGGIEPINYGKDDVQVEYSSGDLAYWIPGQDFVIFTETKKSSSKSPDLVILGQISPDIKKIKDLGSTIKVTIALDR